MLTRFRHIVVEGPIGVGKSTLARRLAAHLHARLLLERPEDNPFLERYYREPARYALQTQLFFLFQRIDQLRELAQPRMFAPLTVSDFLLLKDMLFAQLTLADDEFRLYAQIHAQAAPQVAPPDLVIWLRASPQTLVSRIRQRGIAMEQGLSAAWLERLAQAYTDLFARYTAAPVLAVDTEYFNPGLRGPDFETLLRRLGSFRGPRESFDPVTDWALPI
jgi:deoxyadenosine/deoxycytidine kinase